MCMLRLALDPTGPAGYCGCVDEQGRLAAGVSFQLLQGSHFSCCRVSAVVGLLAADVCRCGPLMRVVVGR